MRKRTKKAGRISPRFFILLLWSYISSSSFAEEGNSPQSSEFRFDRFDIELGSAPRQTVLSGFLTGNELADLVVVDNDESKRGRVGVYSFERDGWEKGIEAILPADVVFVDVLRTEAKDCLIAYLPGQLQWFIPGDSEGGGHIALRSSFVPSREDEIPHVDVTRDLNGDERDDIVLPDKEGFWIATQLPNGELSDPIKIGSKTDLSGIMGADGYRYHPWSQSRIHQTDFDHDGLLDLVFWNNGYFYVHAQNETGLYASEPDRYPAKGLFKTDDQYSLARGDMSGTFLHSMVDINGDKITDLVIASLEGRSVSKKKSSYNVHFGLRTASRETRFTEDPDLVFRGNDRIYVSMDKHDFNSDGQADILFTSIEKEALTSGLWKRLKGMMGDDIYLGLEFYLGGKGLSSIRPNNSRRLALDGVPSHREPGSVPLDLVLRGATHERRKTQEIWPRAFNSTLLVGDVTGDGHADLLTSSHPRRLRFVAGVAGPGLFSEQVQSIEIEMPNDEEYTWMTDLNRDGKQDLIMHRPFTKRDVHGARINGVSTDAQQVSVLLAR